ncbi:FtsX-like permease family protein [Streptomyces sp. NPDC048611]|uniref:FtsX-like permease family protein n=1 Tax=Streptomyces sp. NPDC048611 TaxID=3155635 RepID=UPI0034144572
MTRAPGDSGFGTRWQMLRIGRAARRGRAGSATRFVALSFATAALCLALTSLVAVCAGYAGTEERTAARSPQRVAAGHGTTLARYLLKQDTLDDARGYTVVWVEPVSPAADPPPGLTSWPAPGEAVLSPALLRAGAAERVGERYGRLAGMIGPEGLASPGERFAYVRPPHSMRGLEEARPIHGFGSVPEWGSGDFTNQRPLWEFLLTVGGFLLLPAGVCTVLAARMGADERDRRTALVTALGALPAHRRLIVLGEAALPAALGAVAGAVPAVVGCLTDVPVPFAHFVLHAPDLRAGALWLVVAAVLSLVLALSAVTVLHRHRPAATATRPRAGRAALTRFACWACPLFLLAASYGPGLAPTPTLRVLLQVLGTLGGFATLPSLIAAACTAAGSALAELSRRWAGPSALISGRWMAASAATTARLVCSVVIAIGLTGEAQLWMSRMAEPVRQATAVHEAVGDSVLTVTAPQGLTAEFARALPPQAMLVALDKARGATRLTGRCQDLTALRLPCRSGAVTPVAQADERLRYALGDGSGFATTATTRVPAGTGDSALLLSRDGTALDVARIKHTAHRTLAPGSSVSALGIGWISGGKVLSDQSGWLLFFGLLGTCVLAVGFALNSQAEFLRQGRAAAPVAVLCGRRTVFYGLSAWSLLAPVLASGAVGVLVYSWLATPLVTDGHANTSLPLMLAGLGVSGALGLVLWGCGGASAARSAGRWRPSGE